jgi:hypothetical protein
MINYIKKDLTKLYNIGDALCTPDVYFDISSEKERTIIGGGVWNIPDHARKPNANKMIVWAAGKSDKDLGKKIPVKTQNTFLEWTSRDMDLLEDKKKFLPCVSCLNEEIISEPKGDKILIFTNANQVVSSSINEKLADKYILAKNDESKDSFLRKWEMCDKIITNSYHGIYWSLLSGRKVIPFGYSSKFTSVTSLFGIQFPKENLYDVRNRTAVSRMIEMHKSNFIEVKQNPLQQFREMNLKFADGLAKHEVVCKVK